MMTIWNQIIVLKRFYNFLIIFQIYLKFCKCPNTYQEKRTLLSSILIPIQVCLREKKFPMAGRRRRKYIGNYRRTIFL